MRVRRLIHGILAVLLTVGLALSPAVAPAVAGNMSAVMSDMAAMTDMAAMADDMPCCPTEQKSKGCPDCSVAALCALKTAQVAPALVELLPVRYPIPLQHAVRDDVPADGVIRPPPDQPPRHLI